MYALLLIVIVFVYSANALVVPWDRGMYVCEKWRFSHYAHSPVDPMWRYRLDDKGQLILRNESTGLLITNRTDCINQCDNNDKCVAISFRDDNRCIMMTQCLLANKQDDYSYYYKKGFSNGHNYTVDFGKYCHSPYPPLISYIRPATVPKCWEECMRQDGCNYAEIDETLECKLYNECEILMNNYDNSRGMVISGSTLTTTTPTGSPTSKPTPVNDMSTTTPTISPTIFTTDTPSPTPLITRPPSVESPGTVGVESKGRGLSDGAIIGIAIGIIVLSLLIILAVLYFNNK